MFSRWAKTTITLNTKIFHGRIFFQRIDDPQPTLRLKQSKWWHLIQYLTVTPRLKYLKRILPEAVIMPGGSRHTIDPPIMDTDIDFFVYSAGDVGKILLAERFEETSIGYPALLDEYKFKCYRRGKINLIVTTDFEFAKANQTAIHICRSFNIKYKYNRIVTFSILRKEEGWNVDGYPEHWSDLKELMSKLTTGPHAPTMLAAYRIKHGLTLEEL